MSSSDIPKICPQGSHFTLVPCFKPIYNISRKHTNLIGLYELYFSKGLDLQRYRRSLVHIGV